MTLRVVRFFVRGGNMPTPAGARRRARKREAQRELPMLPAVLMRLLSLDRTSETFFDELTTLAEEDPPLAVRLLRVANGSESAPRVPITDVRAAIARLGATRTADMVTAASVTRVFIPTEQGHKDLWRHAIEVAATARAIANLSPKLRRETNTAYTCGLLHDVGRFLMFERDPQSLDRINDGEWVDHRDIVAAEMALFGRNHCDTGYEACVAWGLPDKLSRLVKFHHTQGDVDPDIEHLVRAVQVADAVSTTIMGPKAWEGKRPEQLVTMLETRCFSQSWNVHLCDPQALASRIEGIAGDAEEIAQALALE